MQDDERKEIMDRRSSLRGWRERGGKVPPQGELIGVAVIILLVIVIIGSSLWNNVEADTTTPVEKPKTTPAPQAPPVSSPFLLPAPGITIYSPENITYNTSTPPLNFIVAGSLDRVMLSMDGGPGITIPHDGTIAKIDFARGSPIFIDDFSTEAYRWDKKWNVVNGNYISRSGVSSSGDIWWSNYTIEGKIKLESGKDINIHFKIDETDKNYYRLQTPDGYESISLYKIEKDDTIEKGYTVSKLISASLPQIKSTDWHLWKITSIGSDIEFYIDNIKYIKFNDSKPYLNGKISLVTANSLVRFDDIVVYKPLNDGVHSLTISASNIAGNTSSQTVYFNINTTTIQAETDKVGKIGVPMVKNGLEVTVNSVSAQNIHTNVWISAKNIEDSEKPFKLTPVPVIIDDKGNQYENIKLSRGAEISQTTLYPSANRDGAVFFEIIKDGAKPERLILYINGDRFEFMVDVPIQS